jgi:hypothetical protein
VRCGPHQRRLQTGYLGYRNKTSGGGLFYAPDAELVVMPDGKCLGIHAL